MWSAEIARQLRERGHDVAAVLERPKLRGGSDAAVFELARLEQRVVVTENARDFHKLAAEALRSSASHSGLVFTSIHRFPRGDRRSIGPMVRALDRLLQDDPDLTDQEWLLS